MQRCMHMKYDGQASSGNIAIDVFMPPLNQKKGESSGRRVVPIPSEKKTKELMITTDVLNHHNGTCKQTLLKPRMALSSAVLRELSEKITFEGDVVEQRSLHCVPYSQYNAERAYKTAVVKENRKNLGKMRALPEDRVPRTVRLRKIGIEGGVPVRKTKSDSVLLKCHTESFISLKPRSPRMDEVAHRKESTDAENGSTAPTWEQYVISKLSKGTANVLLPTLVPKKQQQIFLPRPTNNILLRETSSIGKEDVKVDEVVIGCLKPTYISQSVDDSVAYFKHVPHKPDMSKVKNVQELFPCSPTKWLGEGKEADGVSEGCKYSAESRVSRGMRKWVDYPTHQKEEELLHLQASDVDVTGQGKKEPDFFHRKRFDFPLLSIVKEWREKNLIHRKQVEMSVQGLLIGMDNPCESVRSTAVSAIGMVISEDSPNEHDEDALVLKAKKLLKEDCLNVAMVAAVSLFVVNKVTDEAREMLLQSLSSNGEERVRWIALQCLVEYLHHDHIIIKQLLNNLLVHESNTPKHKRCLYMLSKIGHIDMSVQYMIGEKLNSSCWKERVVACQVLPIINTPLTDDIANKLAYLLWNDWNAEVRKAATEALGKTGNGKIIHNLLREQLQSNDRTKQVSAVKKIASVGIMTAHLLTPLLLCLKSTDDEVCIQTIKLSAKMKLNDPLVLDALLQLLKSDRACKVRRFVLRALGTIGQKTEAIRSYLLWIVHFEKEPILRKEACSTIMQLNCHDDEVVGTLQDLVLGDRCEMVRQEVVGALSSMGVAAVGNVELMERIQQNVKEMCSKDNVVARVVHGKACGEDRVSGMNMERGDGDSPVISLGSVSVGESTNDSKSSRLRLIPEESGCIFPK